MIRISNISFFPFFWKNGKLDWPKCARTEVLASAKRISKTKTSKTKGRTSFHRLLPHFLSLTSASTRLEEGVPTQIPYSHVSFTYG